VWVHCDNSSKRGEGAELGPFPSGGLLHSFSIGFQHWVSALGFLFL